MRDLFKLMISLMAAWREWHHLLSRQLSAQVVHFCFAVATLLSLTQGESETKAIIQSCFSILTCVSNYVGAVLDKLQILWSIYFNYVIPSEVHKTLLQDKLTVKSTSNDGSIRAAYAKPNATIHPPMFNIIYTGKIVVKMLNGITDVFQFVDYI